MNSPVILWIGIILTLSCYFAAFVISLLTKLPEGKKRLLVWTVWGVGEAFNLFLIVNNYLIEPKTDEAIAEMEAMQAWRAFAKTGAKQCLKDTE